ncbi:MAG: hypothetical protein IKH45_04310 [Neisseriaceae bacterium]|nr:hypothetical protein [Neisseriaceae bacterium]
MGLQPTAKPISFVIGWAFQPTTTPKGVDNIENISASVKWATLKPHAFQLSFRLPEIVYQRLSALWWARMPTL